MLHAGDADVLEEGLVVADDDQGAAVRRRAPPTSASYDAKSRLLVGSSSSSSWGAGSASSSAARVARNRSPPESVADQPVGRPRPEQEPGQLRAHRFGSAPGARAATLPNTRRSGSSTSSRWGSSATGTWACGTRRCSSVVLPRAVGPGDGHPFRPSQVEVDREPGAQPQPVGGEHDPARAGPRCRAARSGSRGPRGSRASAPSRRSRASAEPVLVDAAQPGSRHLGAVAFAVDLRLAEAPRLASAFLAGAASAGAARPRRRSLRCRRTSDRAAGHRLLRGRLLGRHLASAYDE